jgi:hypothetical protein
MSVAAYPNAQTNMIISFVIKGNPAPKATRKTVANGIIDVLILAFLLFSKYLSSGISLDNLLTKQYAKKLKKLNQNNDIGSCVEK